MRRWKTTGPWIAAVLVVAAAVLWLSTAQFQLIDRLQFVGAAPMRPLSSGHEMIQTIKAPGESISRIDLTLGKQLSGAQGEITIQLLKVEAEAAGTAPQIGETLREITYSTGEIDYTVIRRFDFDPVNVTPGATYGIRLTSGDPEETAVLPGASPGNNYDGGRLYIDGTPTEADLYIALFHRAGAGEMLKRMEPWRPFPLGSPVFFVGAFLIGAAAFGWLLWMTAGGLKQEELKPDTRQPAWSRGEKPPLAEPEGP